MLTVGKSDGTWNFTNWPISSVSLKALEVRELPKEEFVLLAPTGHPVACQQSVWLSSLAGEPFVFCKGRARDSAVAACRAAGFQPRVACESQGLETVRALVAAGLGLAIVPQLVTRSMAEGLQTVRLREPRVERKLGLVTRRGQELSKAAQAFAANFKDSVPARSKPLHSEKEEGSD